MHVEAGMAAQPVVYECRLVGGEVVADDRTLAVFDNAEPLADRRARRTAATSLPGQLMVRRAGQIVVHGALMPVHTVTATPC